MSNCYLLRRSIHKADSILILRKNHGPGENPETRGLIRVKIFSGSVQIRLPVPLSPVAKNSDP